MSRVVTVAAERWASSASAWSMRCSRSAVAGSSPTRPRTALARLGDIAPYGSRDREKGENRGVDGEGDTGAPLRQSRDTGGLNVLECLAATERQPSADVDL